MPTRYYGPLLGLAASLSLSLAACGGAGPPDTVTAGAAPAARAVAQKAADPDPLGTDQTLWTWLGFAKRPSKIPNGPQTGPAVSPELWQAAHDTLDFAGIGSEDAVTGLLMTKWYSPPGHPDERLRISVFVLSRALRSDSLTVTVERQVPGPDGQWQKTPVAREVADGLDSTILRRAQQIHAENYRRAMYQ